MRFFKLCGNKQKLSKHFFSTTRALQEYCNLTTQKAFAQAVDANEHTELYQAAYQGALDETSVKNCSTALRDKTVWMLAMFFAIQSIEQTPKNKSGTKSDSKVRRIFITLNSLKSYGPTNPMDVYTANILNVLAENTHHAAMQTYASEHFVGTSYRATGAAHTASPDLRRPRTPTSDVNEKTSPPLIAQLTVI